MLHESDPAHVYRAQMNPLFLRKIQERKRQEAQERRAAESTDERALAKRAAEKEKRRKELKQARAKAHRELVDQKTREVQELEELAERRVAALAKMREAEAMLSRFRGGTQLGKLAQIISRVTKATGVTRREIFSHRRNATVVLARQAVYYWTLRLTRLSMPEVGRRLGGRDHTTVMYGARAYHRKRAEMGRTLRRVK